MSAHRRLGRRPVLVGTTLSTLLVVSACYIGTNPTASPVARSPEGTIVTIDWHGASRGRWLARGEVLGTGDRGIYLRQGQTVVLYPFGSPAVLRPVRHPPKSLDMRSADAQALRDFIRYARYPFGLDDELLRRLLDALGQDNVAVMSAS